MWRKKKTRWNYHLQITKNQKHQVTFFNGFVCVRTFSNVFAFRIFQFAHLLKCSRLQLQRQQHTTQSLFMAKCIKSLFTKHMPFHLRFRFLFSSEFDTLKIVSCAFNGACWTRQPPSRASPYQIYCIRLKWWICVNFEYNEPKCQILFIQFLPDFRFERRIQQNRTKHFHMAKC